MKALIKKELTPFFYSSLAYFIIGLFSVFCALYLFFFDNDLNVFENGYASLDSFFYLAPWVLLFIVPAITMRSFAEEKQNGTIELLYTQAIDKKNIVVAKFLAAMVVCLLAILGSLFFLVSLQIMKYENQQLDWGIILSSYIGLILLLSVYTAIGIFLSARVTHMISAYLLTLFINFFCYYGFANLSSYNLFGTYDFFVSQLGFSSHYDNFGKGVFSINSFVYFVGWTIFFLWATYITITKKSTLQIRIITIISALLLLVTLFISLGRFDCTQDRRYTLSTQTIQLIENIQKPLEFEVYLEGDFPADLRQFNAEIKRYLTEFQQINSNVSFKMINPFAEPSRVEELKKQRINPITKRVKTDKGAQEFIIYPYAKAIYNKKQLVFPLIKDVAQPLESNLKSLEFTLAKATQTVAQHTKKKLGVLAYHGEANLENHQVLFNRLQNFYHITPILPKNPAAINENEAKAMQQFDAILIIKPQNEFSETDLEAMDQYIMKGGKTLWMFDAVTTELDSLQMTGKSIVLAKNTSLLPLLFRYGVRVNPNLVQDYAQSAKISLITNELEGRVEWSDFPWYYFPVSNYSPVNHPITQNINPVRFEFVSSIDTLAVDAIKKIPLLVTSNQTALQSTLTDVRLDQVNQEPVLANFTKSNQLLAIALEGTFSSMFTNRGHQLNMPFIAESKANKMIVIADGDIATDDSAHEIIGGDRSGYLYGNEDFLLNSIDYLVDTDQLYMLKNKAVQTPVLDPAIVEENRFLWKWLNLIIPISFLSILGGIVFYLRKKKYAKVFTF